MADEVKKRRVTKKDYDRIESFINDEMAKRKSSKARKRHEVIWEEVDRQISMQPPKTTVRSGNPSEDYHNAIQLGALADALEIIAADVLRFAFPIDRKWFIAHTELDPTIDENGNQVLDVKKQKIADGVIRSLMVQQHHDFSFRDRVKASIKEGLSHGGMVVEARQDTLARRKGGSEQTISAPVWIPHSMHNCFPDPSPHIMGTDMHYRGSMIIRSYMPRHIFMQSKNFIRKELVPKTKAKPKDDAIEDVELITYFGDLSLERSDGDMFLPNFKIVLANGILVYAQENDLPYSPIIYTGYEKDDILDPYYTSPLIKRAPTHKLATELVNRYIDGAERLIDPPGFYDSYDSSLVASGGPATHPGAMTGIKGGAANVKFMEIGDPTPIFNSAQILLDDINKGTSVDSNRAGVSSSGDVTATEIRNNNAKGEVRTVDFLGVLDRQALKPFLHMQHDMNKMSLNNYPFFNSQLDTPDFLRMSKNQLPQNIIFEVVGSKQVLGDEQRSQKFIASVQLASQIQPVAQQTDWSEVTQEIWNFSGDKDAERFVVNEAKEEINPQAVMELQQQLQQAVAQLQQMQQEIAKSDIQKEGAVAEIKKLQAEIAVMEEKEQAVRELDRMEDAIKERQHQLEKEQLVSSERTKIEREVQRMNSEVETIRRDLDKKEIELQRVKSVAEIEKKAAQNDLADERISVKFDSLNKERKAQGKLPETMEGIKPVKSNEELPKLKVEGIDDLIKTLNKTIQSLKQEPKDDSKDVEKIINEVSKPREIVYDKDGKITGIK